MKIRGTKVNGFSDVRLGWRGAGNGCFEVVELSRWMAM
jgi:hypothetical protein